MASLASPAGVEAEAIPSTNILGVQISSLTMPLAIKMIEGWVERGEKRYVCICTVHSVMEATRDSAYREVLNNAGLRTPDGMPLVWLSRRAGHTKVERVAGPDLLPELASRSAEAGHRHFFYGGPPGVADELARRLREKHAGLRVAGTHSPPMLPLGAVERDEVIRHINASGADIVWVGLGSPKQDFWVANHLDRLEAPVLIAVGAAFDFHSGRIKRAPVWMQRSGTEWLFRLTQDPKRLWRRYLIGNARFILRVVAWPRGQQTPPRRH